LKDRIGAPIDVFFSLLEERIAFAAVVDSSKTAR
jgi:hypothetical protein